VGFQQLAPAKVVIEQCHEKDWACRLEEMNHFLEPILFIREASSFSLDTLRKNDRFEISLLTLGELFITRIEGSGLFANLEPKSSLCTLFLPADGEAQCRIGEHEISCFAGHSIAFVPARHWQLTNKCTLGIGIHSTEESLLTRLLAMCDQDVSASMASRLKEPLAIEVSNPDTICGYQQLLMAMNMLEEIVATTGDMPHPFLRIDDLILRTIALILFPEICHATRTGLDVVDGNTLQASIRELMSWMLANLSQPISLTDIEKRCSYGRRAIQSGFKREVGCGPMQWLRRQRLEMAYHRLRSAQAGLNVSSVARQCGYLSLSSFSRDFTEAFKRTPSSLLPHNRRSAAH
jgi:AraC-like DNA-binding protein